MLSIPYTAGIIFLIIMTTSVVIWFYKQLNFIKLINKIPGPPTTPLLGNLKDICCPPEKLWLNLRKFSKEYYPIYKLWACHTPSIFLTLPEDVEILLSSTKHIAKSDMYKCLHEWLGTGLLTSAGNKWHLRRKMLTPAFHFTILKQFLSVFYEQSDCLVDALATECGKPYTDVVPHISRFTLNSIHETAMGAAPDLFQHDEESYRTSIYQMGRFVVHRVIRPWIYNDLAFLLTKTFWQQKKLAKALHVFSLNVIQKRKLNTEDIKPVESLTPRTSKQRLAMLDLLISAQKSGQPIDDEGIREEVDTFMFEGHDTTAMSLSYTLMLLACNQDIQEKVRNEIFKVIENSDEKYSYENLQELKYLEMVIKESLRMYPSVPLISRITSEEIRTHSGYTIPTDTVTTVLIYDIHHNPIDYPQPQNFDPERFSPENSKNRHPFAYIPFSAGPRNCIGQRFAMLELKIVIAKIIQHFQLHPIDTPDTLTFSIDLLMRSVNGVRIKFERRL